MSIASIQNILADHGVPHFIVGDMIYADEQWTHLSGVYVNVSEWTRRALFIWLGY